MGDLKTCESCETLKSQCLLLREEVKILTQKLDNLLNVVFHDKKEFSCQTEITMPVLDSILTADANDKQNSACQTAITMNDISGTFGLESAVPCTKSVEISVPNLDTTSTSIQEDLLMDIFEESRTKQNNVNTPSDSYVPLLIVLPYIKLPNKPFLNFEFNALDQDSKFDIQLNNRSLCYYGISSYSYNGVKHHPNPIPTSGNYLCLILEHLKTVLPDFQYNSVLLTKYKNGSDCLNFHSDNESEIVSDSDIVTISFGQSRVFKFRSLSVASMYPEQEISLSHGDVIIMSRSSQDFFQHSLTPDDSKSPRISITLRMLQPPRSTIFPSSSSTAAPLISCLSTEQHSTSSNQHKPQNKADTYTLYIGDSMLKHLNSSKMCSSSQQAKVFAYSGATAKGVQSKLLCDPDFLQIDPGKVTKIFLLCGTNSVDKILNIPFNKNAELITNNGIYQPSESNLKATKSELMQLITFLHDRCQSASIGFVNILPRESAVRNHIINSLNDHIYNIVSSHLYLKMVSTESDRNLFTFRDGLRKYNYFDDKGEDNVHLNNNGIIRLAKHLKYISHN